MDENFEKTTKPSQVMREILIIPKSGTGDADSIPGGAGRERRDLCGRGGERGVRFSPSLWGSRRRRAPVGLVGLFTVRPNEAKVLQLFGSYKGTVREPGLRWVNPFYTKQGHFVAGAELRERTAEGQ